MAIKLILVIPQPNIFASFWGVFWGVLLSPKYSDNQEHTNNTENTHIYTTNIKKKCLNRREMGKWHVFTS